MIVPICNKLLRMKTTDFFFALLAFILRKFSVSWQLGMLYPSSIKKDEEKKTLIVDVTYQLYGDGC